MIKFSVIFAIVISFLPVRSIAGTGDVVEYTVTMTKVELCSDINCSKSMQLSGSTFEADVASGAKGAGVGSMPLAFAPTIGETFSYIAITMNRAFTVAGECNSGASTCGTATAGGLYKTSTGQTNNNNTSITMYIADASATGNNLDIGLPANWGALDFAQALTWVGGDESNATQARVVFALPKPYTVSSSPPVIKITINTKNTVAQVTGVACGTANGLMIKDPDFQFSIQ
jgi:hypothetical protein